MKHRYSLASAIVAACFTGTAAQAQEACEQQIQQVRDRVQQDQVGDTLRNRVDEMLSSAQDADDQQRCMELVQQARLMLDDTGTRTAAAQTQEMRGSEAQGMQSAQAQGDRAAAGTTADATTDVQVKQRPTDVDVEAPPTEVEVQQQPTEVVVDQQAPEVQIDQPEPQVTIDQPKPEVEVNQAKPQVNVTQREPKVSVTQSEPEVEVKQAEEPEVDMSHSAQRDKERAADEQQRTGEPQRAARSADEDKLEITQIVGETVVSKDGEEVGEVEKVVENVATRDRAMVVDVGGFLGIGARSVALPLDRAVFTEEGHIMADASRAELEQAEPYDENEYETIE